MINGVAGWCVDYGKRDGKRRREYFTDHTAATKAYSKGQQDAKELGRRWANIAPHQRLDVATVLQEVTAAGLTIREVWDAYRSGQQIPATTGRITLRDAIDKLLDAKQKAGLRENSINNLRQVLTRFAKGQDARSLASITLDDVEQFVNQQSTPGSKNTIANRLSAMFSFSVRKGWIASNPCERLERPKQDDKEPEVFTLDQLQKMLQRVYAEQRELIPWMALALFAGLRPEEADQITKDRINLEAGTVKVDSAITKVRFARTVHLEPVAVAWLKLGGQLPIGKNVRRKQMRALRDYMGWEQIPKDALRHTAASHWIALKKSYGAVALEMGNSEAMLRKHYKAEVSPADCAAFWSLAPDKFKCTKKGKVKK